MAYYLLWKKNQEIVFMEKRIEREKIFHNQRFNEGDKFIRKQKIAPFYSIAQHSFEDYNNYIFKNCEKSNNCVLEFGCGVGGIAFDLAQKGANVVGIDISEEAVKKAEKTKVDYEISDENLRFIVMNAEKLEFENDSFDLIYGSAILHHLELEKALYDIKKKLKIGGKAIFLEPLGHNPIINIYRKFTSNIRTPDEHPLVMKDIRLAKRIFSDIIIEYYHILTFLAVPFRNYSIFKSLLPMLIKMDKMMFKYFPFIKPFAWSAIIIFKKNN